MPRRRNLTNPATATVPFLVCVLILGGMTLALMQATRPPPRKIIRRAIIPPPCKNYRKASESQPDRQDLQYNVGDAAYKSGDFTEAEDAFRKTLNTPDLGLQQDTYYNLGNAQFKHGEALEKVDRKKTIDLWEKAR